MNDQYRNNEDEGEGNDPALMPAIESLDDYIRRYGLLDANGGESTLKNRRLDSVLCYGSSGISRKRRLNDEMDDNISMWNVLNLHTTSNVVLFLRR